MENLWHAEIRDRKKAQGGVHEHIWSSFIVLSDFTAVSKKRPEENYIGGVLVQICIHVNLLTNVKHRMRLGQKRKFSIIKLSHKASYYSAIIGVGAYITDDLMSRELWSFGASCFLFEKQISLEFFPLSDS